MFVEVGVVFQGQVEDQEHHFDVIFLFLRSSFRSNGSKGIKKKGFASDVAMDLYELGGDDHSFHKMNILY
jgi:hypothetical protein